MPDAQDVYARAAKDADGSWTLYRKDIWQIMNTPQNICKLMAFYQVDNDWALIEAMDRHIEKLQKKLAEVTIRDVAVRIVREG
jgi:hypothetical protein